MDDLLGISYQQDTTLLLPFFHFLWCQVTLVLNHVIAFLRRLRSDSAETPLWNYGRTSGNPGHM